MRTRARIKRAGAAFLLTSLVLTGCYHYRARAPGASGAPATEAQGEIVWSFAWGLAQEQPAILNCGDQALAEVHQSTNFAFVLLTVATLGFAAPQRVEWTCAKADPPLEEPILPDTTSAVRDSNEVN